MEVVPPQYDDGLEMEHYQGLEVIGDASDEFEKTGFYTNERIYDEDPRSRLKRELKTRQLAMIALGGALGTGLIVNTGPTLARVGPGSMIIGYALVGVLCYAVMAAMGEMAAWLPIPSGFTGFASRFVDPALGFALGWNYWFKYIITTPNNLIASALVVQYWFNVKGEHNSTGANAAIYVAIFLLLIITINIFGIRWFGEFEFFLSSIKVLILLGLIIMTIVLAAGGGPDRDAKGFRFYKDPGAFASYAKDGSTGKFLAFWSCLTSAVFSFLGAELVGVTVGEAQNPRKAIPRAVKLTFFRIVIFYIVLIFLLGMNVPYNSSLLLSANNETNTIDVNGSPFVVAAKIAGVNTLPTLINSCILIFTFSAANSDLYIATRTLYALSVEGNAPRIFSRTSDRGVPIYALGLSSTICSIAFMSAHFGAFKTFQYFISLVTIFGLLTWISLLYSHICFIHARRAQNIPDTALVYVSPFGLYGSWAALGFACVILLFNGFPDFIEYLVQSGEQFDWQDFVVDYLGIPLFVCMVAGYKLVRGSKRVKYEEADLYGGKRRIDEEEAEFLAREKEGRHGEGETKYEKLYRVTLGNLF